MQKHVKRIIWGLLIGLTIYAGLGLYGDWPDVVDAIGRVPVSIMAAAIGLTLVNYGLRFVKWHAFLRGVDVEVSRTESGVVFLAGLSMVITPGKLGELLKGLLLYRTGNVSMTRTAPVVLVERLTDLLGLIIVAAFGIAVFNYGRIAFGATLIVLMAGITVLNSRRTVHWILESIQNWPWVNRIHDSLASTYESTYQLIDWYTLTWSSALSALAWAMEAIAFYLFLIYLGANEASMLAAAFVYSITTILGAISFLPGGLGVTEGSMIGILMVFGILTAKADAVAATYLIRAATLWFGVVVGVVALLYHQHRYETAEP